ncbi:MAG: GNAT family N-acetyltransferase [Clostridiales bacterium]|nr:GNAT family N-acetyltransferase [Clostridiales bacterium]
MYIMELLKLSKINNLSAFVMSTWDYFYTSEYGYHNLRRFICEHGMSEFVQVMQQEVQSSSTEYGYVLHDYLGKIYSFTYCTMTKDLATNEKELYIQYIGTHPERQGMGYASKLLTKLFANPEKYVGDRPDVVRALIDKENPNCFKMFRKFTDFRDAEDVMDMKLVTMDYNQIMENINNSDKERGR